MGIADLTNRFIKEVNEELAPVAEVSTTPDSHAFLTFRVRPVKHRFFDGTVLNVTEEYVEFIRNKVKSIFNAKVDFNNTGSIFWVIEE